MTLFGPLQAVQLKCPHFPISLVQTGGNSVIIWYSTYSMGLSQDFHSKLVEFFLANLIFPFQKPSQA